MYKISVIVPVYNTEKYLSRCITSILNQTYKDFELLIVDDGSSDKSGEICDSFASKDDRIRVFHQKNMGVVAARNLALDNISGEYVLFIDSDDYVDENYLEMLYSNMDDDVDVVVSKRKVYYEDGTEKLYTYPEEEIKVAVDDKYDFEQAYSSFVSCGILYRASVIGDTRYKAGLYVGEDTLFHNTVIRSCRRIKYIPQRGYNYILYKDSALHSDYSYKRYTEVISWKEIIDLYEDMPEVQKTIYPEYIRKCFTMYFKAYNASPRDAAAVKHLKHELRRYIKYTKGFKMDFRIRIFVIAYFSWAYKLINILK